MQSFCNELDLSAAEIRQAYAATKMAEFTPAAAQLKTFNEAIWKITASLVLTSPSGKNSSDIKCFVTFMIGFVFQILNWKYLNIIR